MVPAQEQIPVCPSNLHCCMKAMHCLSRYANMYSLSFMILTPQLNQLPFMYSIIHAWVGSPELSPACACDLRLNDLVRR